MGQTAIFPVTSLTGATHAAFKGAPATFAVASASEMSTTVPAGATTGKVIVTAAGSTLLDDVASRQEWIRTNNTESRSPVHGV